MFWKIVHMKIPENAFLQLFLLVTEYFCYIFKQALIKANEKNYYKDYCIPERTYFINETPSIFWLA